MTARMRSDQPIRYSTAAAVALRLSFWLADGVSRRRKRNVSRACSTRRLACWSALPRFQLALNCPSNFSFEPRLESLKATSENFGG